MTANSPEEKKGKTDPFASILFDLQYTVYRVDINEKNIYIMDPEKKKTEPEFAFVDAVPAESTGTSGPPIPPGHSRFYCEKCRTPYDLPQSSTSWRCANCSTFNSTTPDQCPWCTVM